MFRLRLHLDDGIRTGPTNLVPEIPRRILGHDDGGLQSQLLGEEVGIQMVHMFVRDNYRSKVAVVMLPEPVVTGELEPTGVKRAQWGKPRVAGHANLSVRDDKSGVA